METKTLACGCAVEPSRDFLQRVVGRILEKGLECPRAEHVVGQTIVLAGREHARPGDQ